jgi:hypothetical protein
MWKPVCSRSIATLFAAIGTAYIPTTMQISPRRLKADLMKISELKSKLLSVTYGAAMDWALNGAIAVVFGMGVVAFLYLARR